MMAMLVMVVVMLMTMMIMMWVMVLSSKDMSLSHFLIIISVFQGLGACVWVLKVLPHLKPVTNRQYDDLDSIDKNLKVCDELAICWFEQLCDQFCGRGRVKSALERGSVFFTNNSIRSFVAPSCPENLLKKRDKLFQRATLAWFSHLLVGILSIGKIGTFSILGEGNYHGSCN